MSISTRIRIVFLPILIGSIFLITLLANNITKGIIIENASQNVKHDLELIGANIENLIEEANSCANAAIINVNNYVKFGDVDNKNLNDVQHVTTALLMSKILFNRIDAITYVNNKGDYITSILSVNVYRVGNIKTSDFFRDIQKVDRRGGWLPVHKKEVLSADPDEYHVSFVKKLRNILTAKDMGYIVLNIHESNLFQVYKNVGSSKEVVYRIVDGTNKIVSSDIREEIATTFDLDAINNTVDTKYQEIQVDGKTVLANAIPITNTDWKVISLTPLDELTRDVDKMTKTLMLIGGFVFFIALISAMKLSQTITRPLKGLTDHMKKLKDGILSKHITANRGDEIGILNDSFNTMIDRNQRLLRRIDENEKKKREYELALLQSQIKPHFLYNTLDIINRLAALDRRQEVMKATKNIADFYRIALSKGDEIIPIKREVALVEKYLYIQRIRYPDVFDFELDVSDEILNDVIPKFTLQPLVENAIYHGLKAKKKKGIILITGHLYEKGIMLNVSDNGVGIQQELIKKIFSRSSEMNLNKPYGIINVDERLKLYYGPDYGLEIISEINRGTTVQLRIGRGIKLQNHN